MTEWISVKKKKPARNAFVLVYDHCDGDIFIGSIRKHKSGSLYWYSEDNFPMYTVSSNIITHWMPLPEPPVDS